jgi:hypothetical protein
VRSRTLTFALPAGLCLVAAVVSATLAVVGARGTGERGERAVRAARPDARRILALAARC